MKKTLLYILILASSLSYGQAYDMLIASQQQAGPPVDPIVAIGNLVAWWHMDDIGGTTNGDAVTTWTDRIDSRVFTSSFGTIAAPTLEITGGDRALKFNGSTQGMRVAEYPAIDFSPQIDAFTIIAKVGNSPGVAGTLVGKQESGSSNIQYQLNYNNVASGQIAQNIGRVTTEGFTAYDVPSPPLEGNKVITMAVGTASNSDADTYYDNLLLGPPATQVAPIISTSTNDYPLYLGCRGNGSNTIGFQFEGSIAHVLIFSKKLTAGEVATVVANL